MVSIYLLLRRHYDVSAVTIGLAVGFKQTALFALPIMALIAWRSGSNRMVGLRYLLLGAGVCVLLSLPFLVEVPRLYLESIVRFPQNLCGTTQDYCSIATGTGSPISLNLANEITAKWNLVASGVNNPVNLVLPVFIFLLPASTSILYPSYSAYLILILLVAYAFFLYRTGRLQRFDAKDFLLYVLFALLLLFVFYPLYKYYAVGIIPLLVLLVRSKRDAAGFVAFNLVLLFVPRYLAPLFLLVTLLWLLRARFHKRYITYALVAATAFLVVFTPFVAASAVAFPYTPGAASPPCASGGTLTITTAMSFAESCVLQPHSTINETSAIEIPSGAHASFSVNSTSALPVNVLVRDNTNGYILLEKTSVTFALSSFSLSYGTSYSLVIVNDSNQNNTISISSTISV